MKLSSILAVLVGVAGARYWMEDIGHLGRSPYFADPNYRVFRNVRDYGAVGDGGLCFSRMPPSHHLLSLSDGRYGRYQRCDQRWSAMRPRSVYG
jgi:hypothetical protein